MSDLEVQSKDDTGSDAVKPPAPPRRGIERLVAWSIRRRWVALVTWLLLVVVAYGVSLLTGTIEQTDADTLSGEAARAERLLDDSEFSDGLTENVLIQPRGAADRSRTESIAADLRARYLELPRVVRVSEPVYGQDGSSALVRVTIDLGSGDDKLLPRAAVGPMLVITGDAQRANPDYVVGQVGAGSIGREFTQQFAKDFQRAEFLSLPITFVILVITFGALVAAGVPILLGFSAVLFGLALASITSPLLPANENQPSLILLIGLAVGVDYSLFYVRRVREERAAGNDFDRALHIAAATSGRAIVVSGISVIVAMTGMFLAGNLIFASLALGTILVVAVAVVGSLVALPAMLSLLGDRIDKPRLPLLSRRAHATGESAFWRAVLRPVLRVPLLATLLGLLLIGLLAWPVSTMDLRMPGDEDLPNSYAVVKVLNRVNDAFPSTTDSHIVVVEAAPEQRAQVVEALRRLNTLAGDTDGFLSKDEPSITTSADNRVTKMPVAIVPDAATPAAVDTLRTLRSELIPATVGEVPGVTVVVGGPVAFSTDFSEVQRDRLPLVVTFVVLLCLLVILAAFRSPLIALITGVLNIASLAAAYGILVLIFQNTWAESILGFESAGAIVSWIPLILFVVLFGLSMDYHVFVLSRIREAITNGESTKDAIRSGISRSAGVVTSAALIMVAIFSVFATLSTLEMKQLGLGLAVAILLDATLVRGVLLPGMLALLGRAAWWEIPVMRRLPSIAHE